MRVQHPCGYGLGLLPPTFRLLVVIGFTSGLVFIHNLWLLIGAALVGIGLLLFAPAVRWVLVIVIVGLTACFYFIGNLIFSPAEGGGATFLIFRVNSEGFHYGLAGAVRMSAYLCTSLAFLWSTPIHELYDAVSPLRLLRGPALRVVRELQITMRSYVLIGQSLRIRGLRLDSLWSVLLNRRWQQLRGNLQTVKALFNAIIPRQFVRNREGAIAWANHHPEPIVRPRNSASFALEKVSVRYGRSSYPVLREITYEIPQGSFIFVAGPDRSGKTTLFRAIAGVVPRVLGEIAGTVYIHGIDTTGFSRMRQMTNLVIYIGQDPFASILGLTVGQEMCLWSRHERRARECLAAMGIDHLWERQTTKLSGGQQVRLVLAGLLASEAPVLLLDDPMDQLDPEGCQAFVSALRKLRESEDKIILITDYHNYDRLEDLTGVLPIIDGCTQPILPPQDLARPEFRQFCGLRDPFRKLKRSDRPRGQRIAALSNIHVTLDGLKALDGISLELFGAECVVVTGPNGSGKTTAMLTLAGAIRPDRGSGTTELPKRVGCIFQDPGLQLVASKASEEIAIAPRLAGCAPVETRQAINEGLKWACLSEDDNPSDLHPGKIKMLAIAAMKWNVRLLILDEPTVGIDSFGVEKIITLVNQMLDNGVAVVIVSHDSRMLQLADRIVRFEQGKIIQDMLVRSGS